MKYWGNLDDPLRLAANSSLSMNLAGLETRTTVEFTGKEGPDEIVVNGTPLEGSQAERVSGVLNVVRDLAGLKDPRGPGNALVTSASNFPQGAGIASSAAAFAALAVAAAAAAGLALSEAALSRLARRGSGSACRSVPGGFVAWQATGRDETSFARSIAPPEHWALTDLVAVVSREHKAVGSTGGHALAPTSPLQAARVADTPRRLAEVRAALLARDFERLAPAVEQDSDLMHAVMMTSTPPLHY
ncbi:MAG: diphosphomevalonate decarboxylase, partial [Chloroflexi bacterium]|nr:diphosphomevalonate decarboxylase [Chloroflexota bacterium]